MLISADTEAVHDCKRNLSIDAPTDFSRSVGASSFCSICSMDDYLESLEFRNFQSLQDTRIELSPFFNVIVGPSNLGKSAALRGIKALMRNAPTPGLLREGAKQFDLVACFSNGSSIQLAKGKNKSIFTVNGKEYAKSGVKAPDEVTELWAMSAPDGRELGFASQHETPFLLSEPASAVAKVLGELTNASILMEAVSKANRMRLEALNDVKFREREAEEARTELVTHAGLTERSKRLEDAREALRAAQQAIQNMAEVDALISRHDLLVEDLERFTLIADQALNLDSELSRLEALAVMYEELVNLLANYEEVTDRAEQSEIEANALTGILQEIETEIHNVLEEAGICPLCQQTVSK